MHLRGVAPQVRGQQQRRHHHRRHHHAAVEDGALLAYIDEGEVLYAPDHADDDDGEGLEVKVRRGFNGWGGVCVCVCDLGRAGTG